jgi:hypothetical protein
MRAGAHVVASIAATVVCGALLTGCRSDADIAELLPSGRPDVFDVIVDTCNADLDVTVEETDTQVIIRVRNNDRELFATGGDDCQDGVRIELDAPLGDRIPVTDDGETIPIVTFAPDLDPVDDDVDP